MFIFVRKFGELVNTSKYFGFKYCVPENQENWKRKRCETVGKVHDSYPRSNLAYLLSKKTKLTLYYSGKY
jgi:hypothetical protein